MSLLAPDRVAASRAATAAAALIRQHNLVLTRIELVLRGQWSLAVGSGGSGCYYNRRFSGAHKIVQPPVARRLLGGGGGCCRVSPVEADFLGAQEFDKLGDSGRGWGTTDVAETGRGRNSTGTTTTSGAVAGRGSSVPINLVWRLK